MRNVTNYINIGNKNKTKKKTKSPQRTVLVCQSPKPLIWLENARVSKLSFEITESFKTKTKAMLYYSSRQLHDLINLGLKNGCIFALLISLNLQLFLVRMRQTVRV